MKTKKRKLACLALAAGMMLTTAACAAPGSSSASGSAPASASVSSEASELEEVNLVYYFAGTPQADLATVNEAVNRITKEKINATVELKLIDWSAYDQQMALAMAGGETYDLCFTSNWTNNFTQNVAKGAYLDITELLDEYAPETKANIPQRFLDSATVNGKLYAVPNFQQSAAGFGFYVQSELADKYGFDWRAAESYEDVEPFLAQIKANEPNLIPWEYKKDSDPFVKAPILWGYDSIGDIASPGWVRLDDDTFTVVNQYESEEFLNYCAMMRRWYEAGYLRSDVATLADISADQKAGKYAIGFQQIDISTEDYEAAGLDYQGRMFNVNGIESYDHKFCEPLLTTEKATATLTAISATSEHPERAMMFINLLNTDKELYNLITYGVEGIHYEHISDEMIEINPDGGYVTNTAYEFGNMKNAYLTSGSWPAGSDELRDDGLTKGTGLWYDLNMNADGSPIIGFTFDSEPVKSQIANCQTVIDELYTSIATGSVDPDTYIPQFNEQLRAAGMDEILAEKQQQLNAWLSEQ